MSENSNLRVVPINQIRENPVALRAVNKKDESYTGLVENIRSVGVLSPPTVRELRDAETNQKYYSLVDGLHRFNAAIDAGLETIPVHIITADDAKVLEIQLMANIHKVETKPAEYSKQLNRILANNPLMTQNELAVKLGMSPSWLGQRLSLTKLDKNIAKLVDENAINLNNAYVLAKLPIDEQVNFIDRAMTMAPSEFTPTVNSRVKELRDAKRQGREAAPQGFVPVPHLRKLGEIKSEVETPTAVIATIKEQNLRTPAEIVKATLEWALHLDPLSLEAAKAKAEKIEREENEKKEKRKAERELKRAAAAAAAQEAAKAAAAAEAATA